VLQCGWHDTGKTSNTEEDSPGPAAEHGGRLQDHPSAGREAQTRHLLLTEATEEIRPARIRKNCGDFMITL